jgi:carbon storage regulator
MLVLTRKAGERVCIGEGIVVEVLGIRHGRVRLGFHDPGELRIDREEIAERRQGGMGAGELDMVLDHDVR